jgi:AcrR family transcriptional regulator
MVAHNEPGIAVWTPEELPRVLIKALELRRKGKSYPDIADELGVSLSTAYRYVNNELERLARERKLEGEKVLELEIARLDRITEAIAERVEAGSLDHVETFLKVMDRRAKLLGLNAATMHKVEVEDKRALPDAELYKKTRALLLRLQAAGHDVSHRLLELSPFDAVLDGTIVPETVKSVAPAAFPDQTAEKQLTAAPQSDNLPDFGTDSELEPTPSEQNNGD